jgi:DNA-binding NarL/FixJ family response regulator
MEKSKVFVIDVPLAVHGIKHLVNGQSDLQYCGDAPNIACGLKDVRKGRPDLLIVDIFLERSYGLEVIKSFRGYLPHLKIVVFTACDDSWVLRTIKAGANGCISKRESEKSMLAGIRSVLAGNTVVDKEIARTILELAAKKRSGLDALSTRELEVFTLLGKGKSTRDVATILGLSIKTIESHRQHIKTKLGIKANLSWKAISWSAKPGN